jgi:NADH-quinone oxidoreductase subunit F
VDVQGEGALEPPACVLPGGPSSPLLGAADLDTPLDPDALRSAGSSLGTGSFLVVGRSRHPFDLAVSLAGFFERESCGQCPPCVRGTERLHQIVRALRAGEARARDLVDLDEVAGFMGMHGYCAHCRAAAGALTRLVATHRAAAQAALTGAEGSGRGGSAPPPPGDRGANAPYDPFAPGSPERSAIEACLA